MLLVLLPELVLLPPVLLVLLPLEVLVLLEVLEVELLLVLEEEVLVEEPPPTGVLTSVKETTFMLSSEE